MSTSVSKKIAAIISLYERFSAKKDKDYEWMRWAPKPKRLTRNEANAHFVGVMLDQGQKAERAWDAGQHFIDNNFLGKDGNFSWREVDRARQKTIDRICATGYGDQAYALRYSAKKFPKWIKAAAKQMLEEYKGDPRGIWKVKPDDVGLIYSRMKKFKGIGDALAKMGQFILVRNYGVAGGKKMQSKMSVKPDILVRRVLFRMGITSSERIKTTVDEIVKLKLQRPVDFDAALWVVGRDYCKKSNPLCGRCPLKKPCDHAKQ